MAPRRYWFGIVFLGILLALVPVHARAQTGTATITGVISDETGAALPGVTVTATNQASNVTHVASRTRPATTPSRRWWSART
jgi:hypothetical protein